jgi:hypothetical protein
MALADTTCSSSVDVVVWVSEVPAGITALRSWNE